MSGLNGRSLCLVMNDASGSNDDEAQAELVDALVAQGFSLSRMVSFPSDPLPRLQELEDAGIDLVAVFAGDGTINSVVTGLYGWNGAVLILPGGTMNLLSRRLHGEADAMKILERIAAGQSQRFRPMLARCAQGDALAGLLAGPGTAWAEVREAMREFDLAGVAGGAALAIGESTNGEYVCCDDPAAGRKDGYPLIMVTPREDGLALDGYYSESLSDLAAQGLALLKRNFREGPHDRIGILASVTCASRCGEPIGLLLDGEPVEGDVRQAITLAQCEVDLIATSPQEIA